MSDGRVASAALSRQRCRLKAEGIMLIIDLFTGMGFGIIAK